MSRGKTPMLAILNRFGVALGADATSKQLEAANVLYIQEVFQIVQPFHIAVDNKEFSKFLMMLTGEEENKNRYIRHALCIRSSM